MGSSRRTVLSLGCVDHALEIVIERLSVKISKRESVSKKRREGKEGKELGDKII